MERSGFPETEDVSGISSLIPETTVILHPNRIFYSIFKWNRYRTKSILRIRNGDTIVIGGLLRTDYEKTKSKVPFFSDIPVLGAAFRHKDNSDSDRELVIFITPHIVPEGGLSKLALRDSPVPIVREQTMPAQRLHEVENALTRFENR